MALHRLFVRRRDGRIEVKLNDAGREFVRQQLESLVAAQEDLEHEWHSVLAPPIDPSQDLDDPLRTYERQKATASGVELALLTVDDQYLNDPEAWAWLRSLQLSLRGVAAERGLHDAQDVEEASEEDLALVQNLQLVLFALAEVLS